jgi:putative transposase
MTEQRRRLKRIETPGHARYLTCSCYRHLPLFNNDRIKDAFADRLAFTRQHEPFALYAWVLMPDHFHLIVQPTRQTSVNVFLRRLKARFAKTVIQRWRELEAPILSRLTDAQGRTRFWQPGGGYDRNIVTYHDLHEKIQYIHENPVRRALCQRPVHWLWSSARWYEGWPDNRVPIDPLP